MGHDFIIFVIFIIFGLVTNVFTHTDTKINQVNAESQADLVLIEALQAPTHGSGVLFSIDSTVAYLVVDIENVTQQQNCTAFGPKGTPYLATDANESSDVKKQIHSATPSLGLWALVCTDQQTYTVFVWGESDVTLLVHFLDSNYEPISGDPIQDTNVTVGIEISGMENLKSVSSIEIISESGRDVNIYSVKGQGAGRHHNFFRQEISVPRQPFRVGVTAIDMKNITVRRQTAAIVHPQTFTVALSQIAGDSSPGTNITFTYCINNYGNRNKTYSVQVLMSSLKLGDFQSSITHANEVRVPLHAKHCGWFDVTISASSSIGTSCDVTLSVEEDGQNIAFAKRSVVVQQSNVHSISTVENLMSSEAVSKRGSLITRTNQMISENTTPFTGHFFVSDVTSSNTQDLETIGNDFTSISTKGHVTLIDDVTSANSHGHVIQTTKFPGTAVGTGGTTHATPKTDVSPPAFSKLSFIDRCDRRVRCSVGEWVVVFIVQDNESGIHTVTVEDTLHSFVQTENFTDGLSNVPIHGNISTSCCQKEAVLDVVDMMGNKGRYHVTYELQRNATNNTANVPATPEHKLRDLAAIVVGICAGILVVIIVLTAIIQFQSNIVSFFASLKFRRPEKDVEMRVPHKLSINPEAREGSAAPS
ncbi:uncharacterized protein LOC128157734 isoform X1 [Crassostrea angulata]|uniref:uncharacterized protein LOC128157734 isoform X1 n=1 Tax=Magallana angulata TaxID=2784310 RepID=UPI0022B1FBBE|nr:uncharacterized protein LOC128157734 isoform X1 [Crassostrea angulata]